eukprot:GHVU01031625.1.p1 GENE.GHVU01031625.1~~GHVU01031625.1.p1  ORF type:complete len:160 (+),score=17.05 GHVU01031625.1:541-1020(+)
MSVGFRPQSKGWGSPVAKYLLGYLAGYNGGTTALGALTAAASASSSSSSPARPAARGPLYHDYRRLSSVLRNYRGSTTSHRKITIRLEQSQTFFVPSKRRTKIAAAFPPYFPLHLSISLSHLSIYFSISISLYISLYIYPSLSLSLSLSSPHRTHSSPS